MFMVQQPIIQDLYLSFPTIFCVAYVYIMYVYVAISCIEINITNIFYEDKKLPFPYLSAYAFVNTDFKKYLIEICQVPLRPV